VDFNKKIVFFSRLCCWCSPVKVITVLILVDLSLQFVLDSRDLSRALVVRGRSICCQFWFFVSAAAVRFGAVFHLESARRCLQLIFLPPEVSFLARDFLDRALLLRDSSPDSISFVLFGAAVSLLRLGPRRSCCFFLQEFFVSQRSRPNLILLVELIFFVCLGQVLSKQSPPPRPYFLCSVCSFPCEASPVIVQINLAVGA
jgi:hypothetical protein